MKALIKLKLATRVLLAISFLFNVAQVRAEGEKYKAKLSVDYYKSMGSESYLEISAKYKVDKKYQPADQLLVHIYQQVNEDSISHIGEATTNEKGVAKFPIDPSLIEPGDSVLEYEFLVKIQK